MMTRLARRIGARRERRYIILVTNDINMTLDIFYITFICTFFAKYKIEAFANSSSLIWLVKFMQVKS